MRRSRAGQSVVELMLYISVFVIAIVAMALLAFGPAFTAGIDDLQTNARTVLSDQGAASGDKR